MCVSEKKFENGLNVAAECSLQQASHFGTAARFATEVGRFNAGSTRHGTSTSLFMASFHWPHRPKVPNQIMK
jgi:hypothetical protein